ncbi:MAG: ornithine cyclodeaminase family protein [Gammaproteobacteria bacterium]|nr:ornithine cyclodeaminase family protein [Gammaproteobacteria bacterium]
MMASLSAADDPPFLAVKAVVLNPSNPDRGLPQINGLITLLDSGTGLPVAVMDASWVTAVRTAGASAVAATRMARAESSVMAFIGCGVQAHSHLQAFADLFPLTEIRAFGRGSTNRDVLCKTAKDMGFEGIASPTAKDALEGADIVVTSVTFSTQLEPFLDARWLKPGAFISSTDLAVPWIHEGMAAFDRIIIDDRKQEAAMPSPLVETNLICGDLPELVNGDAEGRNSDEERTAFVFRAVVLGDLALAGLAYQKARTASQGVLIDA